MEKVKPTTEISPIAPYEEAIAHLCEKFLLPNPNIEKLKQEYEALFLGLKEFKAELRNNPLIESSEIDSLHQQADKLFSKLAVISFSLDNFHKDPELVRDSLAFYTKDYTQEKKPAEAPSAEETPQMDQKPAEEAKPKGLGLFGKIPA